MSLGNSSEFARQITRLFLKPNAPYTQKQMSKHLQAKNKSWTFDQSKIMLASVTSLLFPDITLVQLQSSLKFNNIYIYIFNVFTWQAVV